MLASAGETTAQATAPPSFSAAPAAGSPTIFPALQNAQSKAGSASGGVCLRLDKQRNKYNDIIYHTRFNALNKHLNAMPLLM